MAERLEIHSRSKGPVRDRREWWFLVVEDDGSSHIEHEWSHQPAKVKADPTVGARRIPIEEFLTGDGDPTARHQLEKILVERSEAG